METTTAAPHSISSQLYSRFADLLSYPDAGLPVAVRDCRRLLRIEQPTVADQLAGFEGFVLSAPLTVIEEAYTHAFDLDALCHLYVGYHIFGESYKRSLLLLGLRKRYRQRGLTIDRELPDHLAVILRYLAQGDATAEDVELIEEAILPSLGKMLGNRDRAAAPAAGPVNASADPSTNQSCGVTEEAAPRDDAAGLPKDHPYRSVIEMLQVILQGTFGAAQDHHQETPISGGADRA